ncbi:MAG: tetratricopeptide repeat protein [Bryobacteraceae bacterium]
MVHSLQRDGLTAEYPVAFAIGSGAVGHSYAVRIGDSLFQSPLSWFSQAGRWDLSPGFESRPSLDFDRRITMECLYCHTGGVRKVDDPPQAITCQRCHAASEMHFSSPRDNTACEQCHLQGEARVLSPGSRWGDAAPRFTTYIAGAASGGLKVVSQVEQLALSKCAQNSAGKLWCGSCHSPHGEAKDQRTVCLSCHAATLPAAHVKQPGTCASCHMPRRDTPEIAHTAYTDHRIRRNANEEPSNNGRPKTLKAWRDPPVQERDRDLALAQIHTGERDQSVSLIQQGFATLLALPEKDAPVFSALGTVLLQKQRPTEAAAMFATAAALEPGDADDAQNEGVALLAAGNAQAAVRQLERALSLDPLLEQAYSILADHFAHQGQVDQQAEILARWLAVMPQNFKAREAGGWRSQVQAGNFQQADEPLRRACDTGDSCYFYGRNLYVLNRFEESLAALKRALPADPRPAKVHVAMAMSLDALGRLPEADAEFKTAVEVNTADEDTLIAYGVFLSRAGRTEEALVPLRKAVKTFPRSGRVRYELGRVLYQLGRLEDAEGELRAALTASPEDSTARRLLSKTLFRLNRTAEAERELKAAEAQGSVTVK